jgi:hypothetical protein
MAGLDPAMMESIRGSMTPVAYPGRLLKREHAAQGLG